MINFLRVLLFSNIILLTPYPVDINAHSVIELEQPIVAITSGASLNIDVSNMLENPKPYNLEWRTHLDHMFPPKSMSAKLVTSGGEMVSLVYEGYSSYNGESVRLILEGENIPTNVKFTKVIIETEIPLQDVLVYWRNFAM